MVPLAKHFVLGGELILRVAIEDVVIALGRRATPNVRGVEATLLDESKVLDEDLVIDGSAEATRLEIVDRVEVGDIDASTIGSRTIMSVLVDVHTKEEYINTMNLLKEKDALCTNGVLGWAALLLVSLEHLLIH